MWRSVAGLVFPDFAEALHSFDKAGTLTKRRSLTVQNTWILNILLRKPQVRGVSKGAYRAAALPPPSPPQIEI